MLTHNINFVKVLKCSDKRFRYHYLLVLSVEFVGYWTHLLEDLKMSHRKWFFSDLFWPFIAILMLLTQKMSDSFKKFAQLFLPRFQFRGRSLDPSLIIIMREGPKAGVTTIIEIYWTPPWLSFLIQRPVARYTVRSIA